MGEYFCWVNVDRKEYLSPCDFGLGNKRFESMARDNELLRALRELLSDEWKNCQVLFLGDECYAPEKPYERIFEKMFKQTVKKPYNGYLNDILIEHYKDVSCWFSVTEKEIKGEVEYYIARNEFCKDNIWGIIDPCDPFRNLFQKRGMSFRYTLNHSKKIGYSLDETTTRYSDGTHDDKIDPLPWLMGYGRSLEPGQWLGDVIGVSDAFPDDYRLLDKILLDWYWKRI